MTTFFNILIIILNSLVIAIGFLFFLLGFIVAIPLHAGMLGVDMVRQRYYYPLYYNKILSKEDQ